MDSLATIRFLNRLRQRRLIPEYALVGGVAATLHGVVRDTKDLDVVILIEDLLREYPRVWSAIRAAAGGDVSGQLIFVAESNTWLDVLATGGDQLERELISSALTVRLGNTRVKLARREYLIVQSLRSWRPDPDYSRIAMLYEIADRRLLKSLLRRHDHDKTLTTRLENLLRLGG